MLHGMKKKIKITTDKKINEKMSDDQLIEILRHFNPTAHNQFKKFSLERKTPELCLKLMTVYPYLSKYIPKCRFTYDIYKAIVKGGYTPLRWKDVPTCYQTEELALLMFQNGHGAPEYNDLPERIKRSENVIVAIMEQMPCGEFDYFSKFVNMIPADCWTERVHLSVYTPFKPVYNGEQYAINRLTRIGKATKKDLDRLDAIKKEAEDKQRKQYAEHIEQFSMSHPYVMPTLISKMMNYLTVDQLKELSVYCNQINPGSRPIFEGDFSKFYFYNKNPKFSLP